MGTRAEKLDGHEGERRDLHGRWALLTRFGFGLAGEGAQSAFHFGLNLALLRSLSAYDYGLFAIVFALGSLALTYSNALVATPVSVALPRLRRPGAADVQDGVFGTVAVASSAVLALATGAGLAWWSATPWVAPAGASFVDSGRCATTCGPPCSPDASRGIRRWATPLLPSPDCS